MPLTIRLAELADINIIQDLIPPIWYATYAAILTPEQSEYMLDRMYAAPVLTEQFREGQVFLLIYEDARPVGFAAFECNYKGSTACKLHKIYLLPDMQGKGAGKLLLEDVATRAREAGQQHLLLNVNRFNKALGFYQSRGFSVIAEEDIDIGNGYFMNDYLMQKEL
ncbi:GNAT family N-acetyltransferase [Taibaiella chishuiensis]|uniref:N-acetylglutamate synthase-like GNAT family acetyltransferase n=1 Tax=Taibaiella chishuiensis TaxID=1434707 RepID=A0A2P8DD41_9BACT|nr:GNAT family N-acetyltransferase [Taibaiella chishuiensis]PSK95122.1 N-acetylglutamate synthase-like GNAT family acetyltransferase [Taibaiella chishuiensis]